VKKLKLQLDALAVESFSTDFVPADAGTVHGNAGTRNQDTCQESCFGTCDYTCRYTCKCVPSEPYVTCIEPCITLPPDGTEPVEPI